MKNYTKPKLVKVMDKRGDELLHNTKTLIEGDRAAIRVEQAIRAEQDWKASMAKLDTENHPMPDYSSRPFGRISAVIFLLIAAFIAGLAVGRVA